VREASTGQDESHFGSSESAAAILQRAVESRLQQTRATELASRVEPTRSVSRIVASSTDSATELPGDPRLGISCGGHAKVQKHAAHESDGVITDDEGYY
jgi:hypothetical protein